MKPVTTLFLLSGAILAVLHFLSIELHLYWRYPWLDLPIHALGGATVALGLLSVHDLFPRVSRSFFTFKSVLIFVLLAALIWEVFEVSIGITFEPGRYVIDTLSDIVIGLAGGAVGYFVGKNARDMDLYV